MSLLDAVAIVLEDAKKPLSQAEITRLLLERHLWTTKGKTPAATIGARLYVDIKRQGSSSRFKQTGKGLFALRSWSLPEYTTPEKKNPQPKKQVAVSPPKPAKTLSFSDSTEQVLLRFGNKKPMHYRDITKRALDLGLLHSQGETPEATLYAQVLTEIARKTRRGEIPRFVKHGKGYIGLTQWMGTGLAFQIEQHNISVRKKLRAQLSSLTPAEFENQIGALLRAIGFEATVTAPSGDGGIDVRGTLVVGDVIRTRMAVQVKRWKQNVQAPVIQQVRGSLGTHEQGLIITTSDFSPGARQEAERANAVPVALMNGDQLVALLVEHNIGIHRNSYDLLELGTAEQE